MAINAPQTKKYRNNRNQTHNIFKAIVLNLFLSSCIPSPDEMAGAAVDVFANQIEIASTVVSTTTIPNPTNNPNITCIPKPYVVCATYNLTGIDFRNANLSNADLSNANLSNADLSNANLSNADLSNADLSNADLSNADLSNANLSNTSLKGTILDY
tara:strand:- start:497 stop:967 length:471 start_codon:yes stop_codon:yes gene_type:complete